MKAQLISDKVIEDTLNKHLVFALSGSKKCFKSDTEYEVILIGATEMSIERSKTLLLKGKRKLTEKLHEDFICSR